MTGFVLLIAVAIVVSAWFWRSAQHRNGSGFGAALIGLASFILPAWIAGRIFALLTVYNFTDGNFTLIYYGSAALSVGIGGLIALLMHRLLFPR